MRTAWMAVVVVAGLMVTTAWSQNPKVRLRVLVEDATVTAEATVNRLQKSHEVRWVVGWGDGEETEGSGSLQAGTAYLQVEQHTYTESGRYEITFWVENLTQDTQASRTRIVDIVVPDPGPDPNPDPQPDPPPTPSTGIGVNLGWPVYHSSEVSFLDLMKTAGAYHDASEEYRYWIPTWGTNGSVAFDENGNPTALSGSAVTVFCGNQGIKRQNYVCTWEGSGEITISGGETSYPIVSNEPNRIEFELVPVPEGIGIVHLESLPVSNLSIRPVDDTGDLFDPRFVEICQNFSVIRFKDSQRTDDSPPHAVPQDSQISYGPTGWSPGAMQVLCNRTGARAWVNIPYWADDAWVAEFAAVCAAVGMQEPYVEFCNEVWNGVYSDQLEYAKSQGEGMGFDEFDGALAWYALRTKQVHSIFTANFKAPFTRVVGGQMDNPWVAERLLEHGAEADVLALNPYAGASYFFPEDGPAPATATLSGAFAAINSDIDVMEEEFLPPHAALGIPLVAYEGGQHLLTWEEGNTQYGAVIKAAQKDTRMAAAYNRLLNVWSEAGGGSFVHYNLIMEPTDSESFGLLEHLQQPVEESIKWQVLVP